MRLRRAVREVAVVVPAGDEEELVGACLDAVAAAAAACPRPVRTIVVLDACSDGTASVVAGRPDATAVPIRAGCVGAARSAGVRLAVSAAGDPHELWIACTDADSRVPPSWLDRQVRLALDDADLVLGTVDLPDDDAPALALTTAWRQAYARRVTPSGHRHVHGASLGVRGSTYLAAGGFAAVPAHEDVLLARAVARAPGARVVRVVGAPVRTSPRLVARAPGGLAADLRDLDWRRAAARSRHGLAAPPGAPGRGETSPHPTSRLEADG